MFYFADFLEQKIYSQIQDVRITKSHHGYFVESTSRFGSGMKDFYDFLDYPFSGLGRSSETRFKGLIDKVSYYQEMHRNNGVSDLLATYGILIFSMYFFLVYKIPLAIAVNGIVNRIPKLPASACNISMTTISLLSKSSSDGL